MDEINKFITTKGEKMSPAASSFVRDASAVTSIEYALLGALIAVVILGSVALVGIEALGLWQTVSTCVEAAAAGNNCG